MTDHSAIILSFSKAKKSKNRKAKEQKSQENRILFGRNKATKNLEKTKKIKDVKKLDDLKIEPKE
jgi:hypothetical protein